MQNTSVNYLTRYATTRFFDSFRRPNLGPIPRNSKGKLKVGKCVLSGFLMVLLFGGCLATQAAQYPEGPVRLVVAFPAGGGLDMTARLLAQKLSEGWGQPVVVDNRPGASGMIGAESVARSPKDGYTLLVGSPAEVAINPALYPKMSYDPFTAFTPISTIAKFPLLVVANAGSPLKSLGDLAERSKNQEAGVPFATSGVGSMQQLVGEWLKGHSDIKLMHVPYKGTGPAMNDLLGGQVPLGVMGLAPLIQHLHAGSLRALAITSRERNSVVPDVPTLIEQGFDFEAAIWFGVLAPAGTPQGIVDALQKDIAHAVADEEFRGQMVKLGGEAVSSTSKAFAAYIDEEFVKYTNIIKDADIKLD